MKFLRPIGLLLIMGALGACANSSANRISVNYYNISGNSTAALDRQIRLKGPKIDGGRHAVAVARIRIIPNVRFKARADGCSPSYAKVNVDAKVTLPAWKGRRNATVKLGRAWDNIDRYTRLHEAVHVSIAFQFAKELEKQLLNAGRVPTCDEARAKARFIVENVLAAHDRAQRKFDSEEQSRIAKIARSRTRT